MIQLLTTGFLLGVFFPFINIVPLETDVQPYALIFATVLVIFLKPRKLPIETVYLAVPLLLSIVFVVVDEFSFFSLRRASNYASLFVISIATFLMLRRDPRLFKRLIYIVPFVWLIAGVMEVSINVEVLKFIIPNLSTDIEYGRGVTGLATEPSFYGIFCLLLLLLVRIEIPKDWLISLVLLVQIVVLAKSAITILLLAIFAFYYLCIFMSPTRLFAITIIVVGGIYLIMSMDNEARVVFLASKVLDDPQDLLFVDTSINARVSHVLFSILGSFENLLLPHGFNKFDSYVTDALAISYSDYLWLGTVQENMPIMSGYGAALFELGFVGLIIPIMLTRVIVKSYRTDFRMALIITLFVHTIMFSAIQLGLPIFGLLIGYFCYRAQGARISPLQQIQAQHLKMSSLRAHP